MTVESVREARFWAKVDRQGPDECWPWLASRTGGRGSGAYGQFHAAGLCGTAHRYSFWLANGFMPEGEIGHSCHNGLCVNPKHLHEVTRLRNEQEKDEADRRPRGVKNLPCPTCGGPQEGRARRKQRGADGSVREFAFCVPCRKEYLRDYHTRRKSALVIVSGD